MEIVIVCCIGCSCGCIRLSLIPFLDFSTPLKPSVECKVITTCPAVSMIRLLPYNSFAVQRLMTITTPSLLTTCKVGKLQHRLLLSSRKLLSSIMAAASGDRAPRIVDRKVLQESKFLRFVETSYVRPPDLDKVRSWQAVERTTTDRTHGIDGTYYVHRLL